MTDTLNTPTSPLQATLPAYPSRHREHVQWLMHQYALTQQSAEQEAQDRYRRFPAELQRWSNGRDSDSDGRLLDLVQERLEKATTADQDLASLREQVESQNVERAELQLSIERMAASNTEALQRLHEERDRLQRSMEEATAMLEAARAECVLVENERTSVIAQRDQQQAAAAEQIHRLEQLLEAAEAAQAGTQAALDLVPDAEARQLQIERDQLAETAMQQRELCREQTVMAEARLEAVEELQGRLTAVQQNLQQARQRHLTDVEAISTSMMEEAEHRGWCSEYDEWVEKMNTTLSVEMQTRHQDYCVVVHFCVTARNEEDAEEQASQLGWGDAADISVEEQ